MSDLIEEYQRSGDRARLREFYGQESYVRLYDAAKPKWTAKFEILARVMNLSAGDRVLDVGCAAQHFRPFVERFDAVYSCVDISPGFNPDYLTDAETLDGVPSDAFEWVLISDVLEHLPDPVAALNAAARVGRNLVTVVPNWYHLDRFTWLRHHPGDRHITRLPPRKWLGLHSASGWATTTFRGFYYVPSIAFYPWYPLRLFDGLMRKSPLHGFSSVIDNNWAHLPGIRVAGQELIVIATRTERAGGP